MHRATSIGGVVGHADYLFPAERDMQPELVRIQPDALITSYHIVKRRDRWLTSSPAPWLTVANGGCEAWRP